MTWSDVVLLLVVAVLLVIIVGLDIAVRRYWDSHTTAPEEDDDAR